jgi:hypothetical protein
MNMNDDTTSPDVQARLLRLREAARTLQPPDYVETRLYAQLFPGAATAPVAPARTASQRVPTRLERWATWIAWPVSVTAATGLVSWMVYTNPAVAPEPAVPALASYEAPADEARAATPFLALTSLDAISSSSRNELISATLPRATLAEFGLPVSPMRAAEPIDAEFLVGPNGGVLAVRFVESAQR